MSMGEAPGLAHAGRRLFRAAFPNVKVTAPAPGIRLERDVPVPMCDGAKLRVNVFRPEGPGRFPVIMSAHPYGKDTLPRRWAFGYLPLLPFRLMPQPDRFSVSAYAGWEAPDPGTWVPRGYAVVNVDLRGFGTSEGIGAPLSDQEAADYAEAIEWAAVQPWSSGKVGLNGVSYLALSQWKVAALRPRSLAAICPWEGFSDCYRDLAYPGGVREDGFFPFWAKATERAGRVAESLRTQQLAHPDWDDFWAARAPALERIEVPALICASFSDQNLHARGSFEAFRRIGSAHRFLYTHRGGKWSTYYSPEAIDLQVRFFDCFLKGADNGMRESPPVRVEVRSRGGGVRAVRAERTWPVPGLDWRPLHLAPGELRASPLAAGATASFDAPRGGAAFTYRIPDDMEIVGPMKLRLHVGLVGAADAHLFAAVSKLERTRGGAGGREVRFEGSYGFDCDVVAKGWQRIAHRRLDASRSEPHRPFHPCDRPEPVRPGEVVPVDIEILPSATFFARGDALRLVVQGAWFWRRNPLFGMFPAAYAPSPAGRVVLHFGGGFDSHLLIPAVR